ncbi:MAG: hypothetical protein L6437_02760, partial [Kiritimatiellae bacterium]|nr:hypothetical protein [Verrucomicrobiota bacterium]MCG2659151.1 hypothetical protein [Kiritimatiellia bacterium]
NCTFVGNLAATNGGGVIGGTLTLNNCIVYFNHAGVAESNWSGAVSFTNCCTTTAAVDWASGNITGDPMFVDKGSNYGTSHVIGNYRLSPNSPCINAGTNQSWMTTGVDLDGMMRIRYGTVDIGAYERLNKGAIFSVH